MRQTEDLLAILKEPRSTVAESYRGVRASLQRALANGVKSIMFISTYGGDGKSMVCANVAVALTQLFLDVVLVDGDLRRPTLTNLFGAVEHPGLGEYLTGSITLENAIMPTNIDRLTLVPAGVVTGNPGDLLGRPALATFCSSISQKADVVIFDTSPVAACNDALSIGQHIDTTVMVVSPRRWDGDVEVRIRQTLDQHKIPVMGVILNGSTGRDSPGYGYGSYGVSQGDNFNYGYFDSPAPQRPNQRSRGLWGRFKGLFGPES